MKKFLDKFMYVLGEKRREFPILIILFLMNSLLDTLGLGLIGPFLALANNPQIIFSNLYLEGLYSTLNVPSEEFFIVLIGVFVSVVFCVKIFFNLFNFKYIHRFSFEHQSLLHIKLIRAYLSAPYTFHLRNNTALLIQNVIQETHNFCHGILLPLLIGGSNGILILLLVLLLANTNLIATISFSILLLIVFLYYYRFRDKVSLWGKEASESNVEMIRTINHGLGSIKETRVIGCESYFEEQIRKQSTRHAKAATSYRNVNQFPRLATEGALVIFLVGFVALSFAFKQSSQQLISTIGVFALASFRLLPAVSHFMTSIGSLKNGSHTLHKLYEDLKETELLGKSVVVTTTHSHGATHSLSSEDHAKSFHPQNFSFHEKISLKKVTYTYPKTSTPALKEISITIKKGQSIALIGKSGAGKTTLVDVLLGLLTPESGDIWVDQQSIYTDLRAWQNLVGYIPQSIFLTDDTLERNVAFGVPDYEIDYERLYEAIKAAQLEDLVECLPQGIKSRLGERGIRLSGGQRQRVGIARALYHEREILVLDEATAALDNETEGLVTEAIKSLSGTKTIIIIAHRLTTIAHCDAVYQLEHGNVVKAGSYEEVVLSKM